MESTLATTLRYLIFGLGIFLGLPLLGILFLVSSTPTSFTGVLYLLGALLIMLGMLCAPWWTRRSLALVLLGSSLFLVTVLIRMLFPPAGAQLKIITLPKQSGPRLLNRIFDEQDAVFFGARLGPYVGFISPREADSLIPRFSATFHDMQQFGATSLSPFLTTYLHQQSPKRFDAVIAEPESGDAPQSGIIFLHGYGGNFTVQCWLVAKAGNQIDAITVCPSTDPSGHWWNADGQSILRETIAYLHQRGVQRIYLAGLSNGGIGASRLADSFQSDLAGLILISGADPRTQITELPALVITGESDERIPVSMIEEYVSLSGSKATFHLFPGDHFLLLKHADQVQKAMVRWLLEQEKISPSN